jgi:hypothetical protein
MAAQKRHERCSRRLRDVNEKRLALLARQKRESIHLAPFRSVLSDLETAKTKAASRETDGFRF